MVDWKEELALSTWVYCCCRYLTCKKAGRTGWAVEHRVPTKVVTSNSAGLGLAIMFLKFQINFFNFVSGKVRAIYSGVDVRETSMHLRPS